jgi:hypothetical protein
MPAKHPKFIENPAIVAVYTCYGEKYYVAKADLADPRRVMLPLYTFTGRDYRDSAKYRAEVARHGSAASTLARANILAPGKTVPTEAESLAMVEAIMAAGASPIAAIKAAVAVAQPATEGPNSFIYALAAERDPEAFAPAAFNAPISTGERAALTYRRTVAYGEVVRAMRAAADEKPILD